MSDKPSKLRWFQFRLRTLLIAFLVLGLPLSWLAAEVNRLRKQKQAVTALQQHGWQLMYDWQIADQNLRSAFALEELQTPEWVRKRFGPEYSDVVVASVGNGSASDLHDLGRFPNLRCVMIYNTPVPDAAINNLKTLSNLKQLTFSEAQVSQEHADEIRAAIPGCWVVAPDPLLQERLQEGIRNLQETMNLLKSNSASRRQLDRPFSAPGDDPDPAEDVPVVHVEI